MAAKHGGKLNKSETGQVRFDPILKMAAELAAGRERRTMSSFTEMAVEQAVKQSVVGRDVAGNPVNAWQVAYECWHEAPARRILNLASQFPDLLTIRERKILNAIRQLFGREPYEASSLPLFQLTGSALWEWLCRYADDEITFEALAEGTRELQMNDMSTSLKHRDEMTNTTETSSADQLEWDHEDNPATAIPSWYAVLYSWDENEGILCSAMYWNGSEWAKDLPIYAHAGPFADEQAAELWARQHDPEQ